MSRISTLTISQRAIDAMLNQQAKVSNTQLQISTGRRVLNPADDPASASRILGLNQALETVQQYQSNIDRAQSRLETEEGILKSATNLLQRAGELAVQGNNDTLSRTDSRAIAVEVRQLLEQLYSMANTKESNGEYIFAGYQSGTAPFTNPAAGSYVYNGDLGERQIQISPDRRVADGDNGFGIFMNVETAPFATFTGGDATDLTVIAAGDIKVDGGNGNGPLSIGVIPAAATVAERAQQLTDAVNSVSDRSGVRAKLNADGKLELNLVGGSGISMVLAADAGPKSGLTSTATATTVTAATTSVPRNIFETLDQLATELENNQPVDRYIDDVHLALDGVISTRTSVGGRLNSIDEQQQVNADLELSLQNHKSAEEDLDFAEAIARFERQMTALQAAQQSYVKIKGLSLFNFLN